MNKNGNTSEGAKRGQDPKSTKKTAEQQNNREGCGVNRRRHMKKALHRAQAKLRQWCQTQPETILAIIGLDNNYQLISLITTALDLADATVMKI